MRKVLTILLSILFLLLVSCKDSDSPTEPGDGDPETETIVTTISSTQGGTASIPSGMTVQVIPGTVPLNQNGESASVSFSIESPVESPAALSNGTFVGNLVKYGPESFNFRWPVKVSLPYPEGEDPADLHLVYFDPIEENWRAIPTSYVETDDRKISADKLTLGIFGLAKFTSLMKVESETSDGGFEFSGSSSYYYTLTVASVRNYKYPNQATWYGNIVGTTGSSGSTPTGGPRQPTHFILPQATYQIWITRTTPGTMSTWPIIETYTVPAEGTLSGPVTWSGPLSTGSGWTSLGMPGGGSWVEGRPEGWSVPTVTYGNGNFQATLTWVNNDSHQTDLDLHLFGPSSMHVYYGGSQSSDGSVELDRDWLSEYGNATENIYSLSTMPGGSYTIKVNLFSGDPVNFSVRIIRNGSVKNFSGSASVSNSADDETKMITVDSFSL